MAVILRVLGQSLHFWCPDAEGGSEYVSSQMSICFLCLCVGKESECVSECERVRDRERKRENSWRVEEQCNLFKEELKMVALY